MKVFWFSSLKEKEKKEKKTRKGDEVGRAGGGRGYQRRNLGDTFALVEQRVKQKRRLIIEFS